MALPRPFAVTAESVRSGAPEALSALLALGRPLVMGILNVTPDSFSDGGRFLDADAAIGRAAAMASNGADILDIGAESTRPYGGATPVSADEELRRLTPVLPAALKFGPPVSIDSNKAEGCRLGARPRRGDGQRRLGTATRSRHGKARCCAQRAGHRDAQPRHGRCRDRHRRRRRRIFRPLARKSPSRPASAATRSCSIPASASARRRSRASLASPGSGSLPASACRFWSALRASASSIR